MAGDNDKAVDGCHRALVLAERELNRPGTLGIVTLAREWDRLILRHMARFFDRRAPLIVSLERLLILLSPIEACSAVRGHALLVPENRESQPVLASSVFRRGFRHLGAGFSPCVSAAVLGGRSRSQGRGARICPPNFDPFLAGSLSEKVVVAHARDGVRQHVVCAHRFGETDQVEQFAGEAPHGRDHCELAVAIGS